MRILFCIVVLFFSSPAAQSRTLDVCSSCTFRQIQPALDEARDGDLILVHPGRYLQPTLIVRKAVTLRGKGYPQLEAPAGQEILVIDADGVTVEGLQFQNLKPNSLRDLAAIRVKRRAFFNLLNNRLIHTFFGIYLEYAHDGQVRGNTIIGQAVDELSSGNGIHGWYGQYICIEKNYIKGHRDGIYLEFMHFCNINDNYSEKNARYGLHFMFSNDDQYCHNTFYQNGAGVAVMYGKRIGMYDNLFDHNWGRSSYGLLLKEIYDGEIRRNTFATNTVGIHIEGASRIRYENNTFQRNGWAVRIAGGCLDNHFHANNFLSNAMDFVLNGRVNSNTFNGNYWTEYAGYDLDRDQRGDVPHRPVKLFSYIVSRAPESIVLLRSLFIELLNFSEKVSPAFTPAGILDEEPLMHPVL
jgi:nitrous oxidase accessory protein